MMKFFNRSNTDKEFQEKIVQLSERLDMLTERFDDAITTLNVRYDELLRLINIALKHVAVIKDDLIVAFEGVDANDAKIVELSQLYVALLTMVEYIEHAKSRMNDEIVELTNDDLKKLN